MKWHRIFSLAGWLLSTLLGLAAQTSPNPPLLMTVSTPVFSRGAPGEFTFDTGLLRGTLRPGGKSLGLNTVVHVPSGQRLDQGNGLMSHYRVFTKGIRYGGGAWDWPSHASLGKDGSVEVRWEAVQGRPFKMHAVYRWHDPATLDLETTVQAEQDLAGFESFLASYFSESFTNAAVFVARSVENDDQPGFLPARSSYGAWLMFPRDPVVTALINDGRWKLEPHPVNWTMMPALAEPIAWRRDPTTALTVLLMSRSADCFAIASPHQTEGHRSVYFSLFGRDLKETEVARARFRMAVVSTVSDQVILRSYRDYLAETR